MHASFESRCRSQVVLERINYGTTEINSRSESHMSQAMRASGGCYSFANVTERNNA